jgi:serine phosphatase RsbU (regulator of sigma subunit)
LKVRTPDRTVISLFGARALPLGLFEEPSRYTKETVVLAPGDLALFYTDGITDARSVVGEFFGDSRLDQILPDPPTPDLAVQSIAQAVARFSGDGALSDDQTLLGLCRCG